MAFPIGEVVALNKQWTIKDQIGRGGLGAVYRALSHFNEVGALKLIPKDPGAGRELLLGDDLTGAVNVVPVIDNGEWGDYLVLVMPLASTSLRTYLETVGPLHARDALGILTDIAAALESLEGRVVHRDIKPDNILLIGDDWCLADFGISKYADATTAHDTRKFARTPLYAAPEQWRDETARSATDVYAFGIVAYELLTGRPPFDAADPGEIRRLHIEESPPRIRGPELPLHSLIYTCLYKPPEARPSATEILHRLQDQSDLVEPVQMSALQRADAIAVERTAEVTRQRSIQEAEARRRRELHDVAVASFEEIMTLLTGEIRRHASQASLVNRFSPMTWELNQAELMVQLCKRTEIDHTLDDYSRPSFDIIAYAAIGVRIPMDRRRYSGRGHSLWYCDAKIEGEYRWYETAFMESFEKRRSAAPFDLDPTPEAFRALAPITDVIQCAWPFTAIDRGEMGAFVAQWLEWFGQAALGKLKHPHILPERDPKGSWRCRV